MSDPRRLVLRALGWAVSLVLIVLVVQWVHPAELARQLVDTRWDLLLAAMIGSTLVVGVRAVRWRYLFHPERPSLRALGAATTIGYMWNNVLPLRAGELVRAHMVAQRARLPFWTVMATLALERILDVLSVLALLVAVLFAAPVAASLREAALLILGPSAVVVTALFIIARRGETIRGWVVRVARGWPAAGAAFGRWLTEFGDGVRCLATGAHLLPLAVWTAVAWLVNLGAVWVTMMAAGLALSPVAALLVVISTNLAMALPSGPGSIGTLEFAVVMALALYGVSETAALGLVVLLRVASSVPITVAGSMLMLGRAAREGRESAQDGRVGAADERRVSLLPSSGWGRKR